VHQLFLPLVKDEKIKASLKEACKDQATYPTDKKLETENLMTPSYLKQDNNPILQALQLVLHAGKKTTQSKNDVTSAIGSSQEILKKPWYLCC
jgi:hypothetical protein